MARGERKQIKAPVKKGRERERSVERKVEKKRRSGGGGISAEAKRCKVVHASFK